MRAKKYGAFAALLLAALVFCGAAQEITQPKKGTGIPLSGGVEPRRERFVSLPLWQRNAETTLQTLPVFRPASNFPSRRHFRPCGMNTWFPTMPKRSGFIAAFLE